jgi:hypothetical protein
MYYYYYCYYYAGYLQLNAWNKKYYLAPDMFCTIHIYYVPTYGQISTVNLY